MGDENFKAWGEIPQGLITLSEFECPCCGWPWWKEQMEKLLECILGFQPNCSVGEEGARIVGTIYIKCPECSTIFRSPIEGSFASVLDIARSQTKEK